MQRWGCAGRGTTATAGRETLSATATASLHLAHPQQRLLGVRLVLVAGRLDALAHRLREQLLVLDLPQVLVCLLALLLQGSTARGVLTGQGEPWEPQHPWAGGQGSPRPPGRDLWDLPLPITTG